MPTAAEASSPPAPIDERGFSLLKPLDEVAVLRRRRERPAELGRYPLILLGVVGTGAGAALWLTTKAGSLPIGLGILVFGLTLIALGVALHLVLRRDQRRWPEQAYAWEEGMELVLHDLQVKAVLWTDPKLALDLFVHRPRGAADEVRLLYWKMDAAVPPCDLSGAGFDRLMKIVAERRLHLAEYRSGPEGREARAYEIRAPHPHLNLGKMLPPSDPSRISP